MANLDPGTPSPQPITAPVTVPDAPPAPVHTGVSALFYSVESFVADIVQKVEAEAQAIFHWHSQPPATGPAPTAQATGQAPTAPASTAPQPTPTVDVYTPKPTIMQPTTTVQRTIAQPTPPVAQPTSTVQQTAPVPLYPMPTAMSGTTAVRPTPTAI